MEKLVLVLILVRQCAAGGRWGGGNPTPSRGLMPYSSLLFSFLPKFARRWRKEKEDRGTRNLFGKSLFGGVPLPSRVRPEKTRSAKLLSFENGKGGNLDFGRITV